MAKKASLGSEDAMIEGQAVLAGEAPTATEVVTALPSEAMANPRIAQISTSEDLKATIDLSKNILERW